MFGKAVKRTVLGAAAALMLSVSALDALPAQSMTVALYLAALGRGAQARHDPPAYGLRQRRTLAGRLRRPHHQRSPAGGLERHPPHPGHGAGEEKAARTKVISAPVTE